MTSSTLDRHVNIFYPRIDSMSLIRKITIALCFAVLVGLTAQIRLPIPWSPLPITGQTFAVLLIGIFLGSWWGGISIAFYIGMGVAGIPWFTGWSGGIGHLAGPTGGYLIGFIIVTWFIGSIAEKYRGSINFPKMLGVMLFANFVLIYLPGLFQLNLWLNLVSNSAINLTQTLSVGLYPFIAGDIVKVIAAALIAQKISNRY